MNAASLPCFISVDKITEEDGSIFFRIYGGGYGHGVGMAGTALVYGKIGKTYKDISGLLLSRSRAYGNLK